MIILVCHLFTDFPPPNLLRGVFWRYFQFLTCAFLQKKAFSIYEINFLSPAIVVNIFALYCVEFVSLKDVGKFQEPLEVLEAVQCAHAPRQFTY